VSAVSRGWKANLSEAAVWLRKSITTQLAPQPYRVSPRRLSREFLKLGATGFGGGIGILVTPVVTLVFGPVYALGILLPLLSAGDAFSRRPANINRSRSSTSATR